MKRKDISRLRSLLGIRKHKKTNQNLIAFQKVIQIILLCPLYLENTVIE